jgi:hypothetical protein
MQLSGTSRSLVELQGNLRRGAATNTAAVTGTTGAYANTGGVLVSKDAEAGADETITLVD